MIATTQPKPQSSSPDLTFHSPLESSGPLIVLKYAGGQKRTLDLFQILSDCKVEAKAKGEKRIYEFLKIDELLMKDPSMFSLKLSNQEAPLILLYSDEGIAEQAEGKEEKGRQGQEGEQNMEDEDEEGSD